MKKKIALVVVGLMVIGSLFTLLFMEVEDQRDTQAQETDDERKSFDTKRSAAEFSAKREELRKRRSGLPTEQLIKRAQSSEQLEALQKELLLESETPMQALEETRQGLARIENQISQASSDEELARLEKQKKLVEEVLSKLEAMNTR